MQNKFRSPQSIKLIQIAENGRADGRRCDVKLEQAKSLIGNGDGEAKFEFSFRSSQSLNT
jgi:hypothetical protein